jgi:predicted membrane protein
MVRSHEREAAMSNPVPTRPEGPREPGQYIKVLLGAGLVLFGFALLAGNLGWFDMRRIVWSFWPTILIVAGAALLAKRRSRQSLWGFVFIFWGLWIYADQLGWIRVNFWAFFGPTLLVLIGGTLVWRAVAPATGSNVRQVASDSYIRTYALLSGSEVRPQSLTFKGAEATAVMGGVKLDLTGSQLEGDTATIDVFALMGGIEIYVPRDWEVVNDVTSVLGACVDKRRPSATSNGKRVVVSGMALLGGIEIKDS